MTQKKLLILAGVAVHSKVVRAAKELGIYTWVLMTIFGWFLLTYWTTFQGV